MNRARSTIRRISPRRMRQSRQHHGAAGRATRCARRRRQRVGNGFGLRRASITGVSSARLNGIRVSLDSDTTRMASTSSETLSKLTLFCRPPSARPRGDVDRIARRAIGRQQFLISRFECPPTAPAPAGPDATVSAPTAPPDTVSTATRSPFNELLVNNAATATASSRSLGNDEAVLGKHRVIGGGPAGHVAVPAARSPAPERRLLCQSRVYRLPRGGRRR